MGSWFAWFAGWFVSKPFAGWTVAATYTTRAGGFDHFGSAS